LKVYPRREADLQVHALVTPAVGLPVQLERDQHAGVHGEWAEQLAVVVGDAEGELVDLEKRPLGLIYAV
jgi:hypothetical protein